ncbi:putative monovalent cation/H+ antiporter subunit C [Wolbachia endosymbiont of Armadillidium vulgare str. wVulC]|uniref:Cation:proton antiporter subunit C n=1 Tax=Wolbachia endosymbiont of Armadillidium arcangelii TaxID=3158571 RepID=A0AAU7Q279_9RICK|nr:MULTISPECIES: cation:proton antiporter subunit C [unclassified Wolbachia]OJH31590.1 Na(+)/H(+) antiporter subunit C1 [Wolbachia endosymbiont of Armadillidium vulgare]KLT22230.1 putative monovalent cation/H+ antiporter subunit C [Wolbachia endosymbiont of Armadillidium vulgare str. wVulC]OJH32188.1 Na(+)/H(+) antiporter subunit C1 [Wolbachia endosymbiont of Armadillidium vulgare]OJH33015.1 Na(+)/H(+) antiporter subunit C1 [Wolbachia endosymbiont of Armadillidium vulgare]RDD35044.1 Mrp comple
MTLYNYIIITILMVLGLYIIINDKNLIKKMIGLSVLQASILLFYISLGYIKSSLPPILTSNFYLYSNPIPHVLMLTAIVVGIATFSVGLSIAVRMEGIID